MLLSWYTLAMLGEITKRRNVTVDYQRIWISQAIDGGLSEVLEIIAREVHEDITRPPQGISNISEWCKKDGCWDRLSQHSDRIANLLAKPFWSALTSSDEIRHEEKTARQVQKIDNGVDAQKRVFETPVAYWSLILKEGVSRQILTPKEMDILRIAERIPAKVPSAKQSAVLIEVLDKARLEGII